MEAVLLHQLEGHNDRVWSLAWNPFSSSGYSSLATTSGDKTARIWEGVLGSHWNCQTIIDTHKRTVRSCDWSPDGKCVALASFDATASVWERVDDDYQCVATIQGHENEVKSVSWSPSGSLLATCSRDKSVWILEVMPGYEFECVAVLTKHTQDVKMVLFHPVRDIVVSASYDDTIKVWALEPDGDDWICVQTLEGHTSTVWQVSFNSTGDRMVSCSDDQQLIIWDTSTDPLQNSWKRLCTISGYHDATIFSVHWSSKSGLIASGAADDTIRIFAETQSSEDSIAGLPSFTMVAKIEKAHASDVNCVRWHPQEPSILASAGDDGIVKIWKLPS